MKILIIIDNLIAGGKERRLVELLKGIAQQKDLKVELVLLGPEFHFQEVKELGIPIHILIRRIKKDPVIFIKLYNIIKRIKPNYIHSWGIMPTFYSIPISRIFKVPILNSMISNSPETLSTSAKIMSNYCFRFSEKIIANSLAGLNAYSAPIDKSLVIHNGFDFKRLGSMNKSFSLKTEYSISTKYIVGMVATFSEKKDYKSFIEAARIILEKRNDVTFIAVGAGSLLEEHRKIIHDKKNFIFLGGKKNIEEIVRDFDIGVLSTFTEGISNSVMEYMALSKPTIVTDGGGSSELVVEGETGFLIPPRSPNILASKINHLLNNPELGKKMGLAGFNRLHSKFNLERMVSDHLKLYRNGSYES